MGLSRLLPNRLTLPKVLKVTTQNATAEGDDGVGTKHCPVPSGTFESSGDGDFAASLDNPEGSATAHLVEMWVAHSRKRESDAAVAAK